MSVARRCHPQGVDQRKCGARVGHRIWRMYGAIRTFFLDDDVFVEPNGFWVRGGRSTEVALEHLAESKGPGSPIFLRNGPTPNEVILDAGSVQRFSLKAGRMCIGEMRVDLKIHEPKRIE